VVARRGMLLVDAIVGSILLGVALTSLVALASRALSAQTEGEELQTAAMLVDEQLSLVLARGPDSYASRFDTEGECDPPFQRFHFTLAIAGGQGGDAYKVTATVTWTSAGRERSESVETSIAPRLGDDPDPDRRPPVTVDRMQ
jgi:Tfp pilus assembly protein PilV